MCVVEVTCFKDFEFEKLIVCVEVGDTFAETVMSADPFHRRPWRRTFRRHPDGSYDLVGVTEWMR